MHRSSVYPGVQDSRIQMATCKVSWRDHRSVRPPLATLVDIEGFSNMLYRNKTVLDPIPSLPSKSQHDLAVYRGHGDLA